MRQKDCELCEGTGTIAIGEVNESACPNKCWLWEEKSGNLGETRNAVLADVLADIDKKDLTGGGGVLLVFKRDDLKEVLSKYFS